MDILTHALIVVVASGPLMGKSLDQAVRTEAGSVALDLGVTMLFLVKRALEGGPFLPVVGWSAFAVDDCFLTDTEPQDHLPGADGGSR